MPMNKQDEEMAIISELVLGYREGLFSEVVQAIASIKLKAIKHEQNERVELLFEACGEISQLVEDIRGDV
jgi:hypothetical protein